MKKYIYIVALYFFSLFPGNVWAMSPFTAFCKEGETHRYDDGNGVDMMGIKIKNPEYGWHTTKWGDMTITWAGGKTIVVDGLNASVVHLGKEVIGGVWTGEWGMAVNIYSLIMNTSLKKAVFTQVQASQLGKNRSMKVRSSNHNCKLTWLRR